MTPPPRHHAAPPPPLAVLVLLLLLLPVAPAAAQPPSRDKDNGGGAGGGGYMQQNQAPGFSAPMVVLLVALIVGFFFIGFFSVYMRRCGRAASPGGPSIPAAALLALSRQEQRDRQQQRGLDPAVLASFPTMRYAEARELRVGGKDAALECAVCLSEFDDDEELRLLPKCSHAFHTDCIGEWLAGHVTCPVCRCNLNPEEELAAAEANGASGEVAAEEQLGDRVVAIDVGRDGAEVEEEEEERRRREEAVELERIGSQRRALRSRSGRRPPAPPLVPPRSHSTGHSLGARLDGDLERFTLRLPEHVRREMVAAGEESLRRTGRDREGGRAGAARSARLGRSDRWPSFITRTFSSRVPFWSASRRAPVPDAEAAAVASAATAEASARTKREKTAATAADGGSVTTPKGSVRFDCLGSAAAAVSGARVGAAAGDSETEDDDEEKAIARLRQA